MCVCMCVCVCARVCTRTCVCVLDGGLVGDGGEGEQRQKQSGFCVAVAAKCCSKSYRIRNMGN